VPVVLEQPLGLLHEQLELGLVAGEPTCRTILRWPATDSAICTVVDPDAVRTRRTQATSRVYEPD
jgi:hypothetical protein